MPPDIYIYLAIATVYLEGAIESLANRKVRESVRELIICMLYTTIAFAVLDTNLLNQIAGT